MAVALVTGAGRGLGAAMAHGLARRRFYVVANDINPAAAERTAEALRAAGGAGEPFHADVANRVAVGAMVEEIVARLERLDLVVHHAEVHPHRSLLEMGEYEWDRTVAVILKGAFHLLQAAAPRMIERGGGGFVFIVPADVLAGVGFHPAYAAAKAGLLALARAAQAALHPARVAVHLLWVRDGPETPGDGLEDALDRIARGEGPGDTFWVRWTSPPR